MKKKFKIVIQGDKVNWSLSEQLPGLNAGAKNLLGEKPGLWRGDFLNSLAIQTSYRIVEKNPRPEGLEVFVIFQNHGNQPRKK